MRLEYAHLCDHITIDRGGKPTFIGVFRVFHGSAGERKPWEPVTCGRGFIAADLRLSVVDPESFTLVFRLVTADGDEVHRYELPMKSVATEPGIERENLGYVQLEAFQVPDFGDYSWEFSVDGVKLGEIPMLVRELRPVTLTIDGSTPPPNAPEA